MKCREVLTENPVFCLPDETVGQVARLMRRERVGSVPVVTDEQRRELVGIVTDQDLAFKVVGESRDLDRTTVFDIMTRAVVACRDDDEVDSAIRAMAEHEVRRIPIVNYAGHLVGIISQGDVALRIPLLTAPTHHLWRVA